MKRTIAEIKRANREAGYHFFDRDSMRFFNSVVYSGTYEAHDSETSCVVNPTYFITSEQFRPSQGPADLRRYTVRVAFSDGSVDTFGEFQAYATLAEARDAAKRAARMDDVKTMLSERYNERGVRY